MRAAGKEAGSAALSWALAALSFAALVGLALATTSTCAANIRARARLHATERDVIALTIHRARAAELLAQSASLEQLAACWQRCLVLRMER